MKISIPLKPDSSIKFITMENQAVQEFAHVFCNITNDNLGNLAN